MRRLRVPFVARPYRCQRWTDTWGTRRWAVTGPEGAVEVCDLTGRGREARPAGLLVVHVYSPTLPAELAGATLEPDPQCPYVPDGAAECSRHTATTAESAVGASALQMAADPNRGPLWLLLATMYGVTFADRQVVRHVLREAAT